MPTTEPARQPNTGFLPRRPRLVPQDVHVARARLRGKRISIDFDGVYMDCVVYLNGTPVGNQPYGYTGFRVDLTARTPTAHANVVAVRGATTSSRAAAGTRAAASTGTFTWSSPNPSTSRATACP